MTGSRRARRAGAVLLAAVALLVAAAAPASAAPGDPLFAFTPKPTPPPAVGPPPPVIPPPTGYLNGPCGLAVDADGNFYIADHDHDRVHVYDGSSNYAAANATGATGYVTQLSAPDPDTGPCYVAVAPAGDLYVGDYHGEVRRYSPDTYPPEAGENPPVSGTQYTAAGLLDPGIATGLAIDAAGDVYVTHRDRVSVYDSAGAHQEDIGLGSLTDAYGLAVAASGEVHVADDADDTVKVYDPADEAKFPADPSAAIDGSGTPEGEFGSLRDASLAIDLVSGELYVTDDTQPADAEQPRARVHVFDAAGAYQGHLKYDVVHGGPTGIAVDNSAANPGRVYLTSGNTHEGGVYAYPPGSALTQAPRAPTIPGLPPGGGQLFPPVSIGAPTPPPGGIACEGDACQTLPPEPVDPTLTTLLKGLGNPKVRYRRALRDCRPAARRARWLSRSARRSARRARRARPPRRATRLRARAAKLRKRARRGARAAKRCVRASGAGASASAALAPLARGERPEGDARAAAPPPGTQGPTRDPGVSSTAALLPAPAGFTATAHAADGGPATRAGSHPYSIDFTFGLDQGSGPADLRELGIELPPGLLLNPAATSLLCSATDFATPRSSPHEASASGESCPERSQVGVLEVASAAAGQTRRFGLFALEPAQGSAFRLGAAPFGAPLLFEAHIDSDENGVHLSLGGSELPTALEARELALSLWGAPWDASHDTERGNCLNEAEPTFPWAKCSVGEPLNSPPRAFLTLPTECRDSLAFSARFSSWQGGELSGATFNRDSEDAVVPVEDCSSLAFAPDPEGFLSTRKASSASGFVFRLADEDPGLADPRARVHAQSRGLRVELPGGVTLNPSLGAGLQGCSEGELAKETATNPLGSGCPNGAKIGNFILRSPFYEGLLRGGVYLATPRDNPFNSLVALYLVAKSAERDILITAAGQLIPDERDGTLAAVFEDLPQLPYTDLEVSFRTGQRAPLVSPPRCGQARTEITLTPWAQGAQVKTAGSNSPISSGIDFGPCPDGSTPPFDPKVVAGGVNSNVGSYTPYFVHLTRRDTEQEITSYSLTLPKGIVGKLAGIPFCSDAAIEAARGRSGAAETANPSCPEASRVGRTDTGYGVGAALTYAPGKIYLAGPYKGQPLSLVTINAATVGPFDLGTIVVRSAFSVDPKSAQLAIDSSASDPIPHIIAGVPLHLRDVRVYMDRPEFTRNPTGCEPSELQSTLTGSGASFEDAADDSSATQSAHFQLLNCLELGFRPRLGLQLRGGFRRAAYPGLRAVFRARGGDANLKRIAVTMPPALFLAQNHIRTVCTRVQFAADACPPGSVYGRASAVTPLFDEPLTGPVVLRSSDNNLPDLVASLKAGEVRIVLEGRIGPSEGGGIRAFFDELPDAPVNRFTMWLAGGKRGLLVNSVNVCARPPKATVKALGQNNRGAIFATRLRGNCAKFNKAQRKRQKLKKQRQRKRQKRQGKAKR